MGRPWQAKKSRETEVAAGRAYRDLGLARGTARAAQVLRMMRSFVRMNPDLARGSRDDFMCAFVGQLTEERNAAGKKVRCHSTIQSYVREIEKYGMRADNLEEIGARLNAAALRAGIAAKRREEDPIIRHRMVAPENYMAPILQAGDPVLRAGAYLLLATGARAEHLTRIRRVQLTPKSVRILWGDRKIRERMNCYLTYPFAWSCPPPKDLEACLREWQERRARLTHSKTGRYVVAQRINDRLGHVKKAKEVGLTSSFYRRRMSTLLNEAFASGNLTEMEFELLLDHRLGTSYSRYRLEGDASRLELDA